MTWRERVDKALKRKRFTDEDKKLVELWATCAISELDLRIPRKPEGGPRDFYLINDGLTFTTNVKANNPEYASNILNAIHKREQKLLKEMGFVD